MINLLRRVRHQYLKEGNYRIYAIYALGEVFLVMMGILLALQVDNWNQKRTQTKQEIDNLENLYFSINEDIQIVNLQNMVEYVIQGEQAWIDYLMGNTPYHDSLLDYGYVIGATAYLNPNTGFYESLKLKGLETIENKGLRMLLSILYEQSFPELQGAMDHFHNEFDTERKEYFRKYFILGEDRMIQYGENFLHTDYLMFRIAQLKGEMAMRSDQGFLEFVKISKLFHQNILSQLNRASVDLEKAQNLISHEYNYARYGTPKRKLVTISLYGYQDVGEVFVSWEFNNWQPDRNRIIEAPILLLLF